MKKRGVGYSCMFYGTGYGNGFPDESRATVELKADGKVMLYVAVMDVGQGGKGIMWQIASETLGVKLQDITVYNSSTEFMKDSGTAAASRQTYNTGNAVLKAAENMKNKIIDVVQKQGYTMVEIEESVIKTEKGILSLKDVYDLMALNNVEAKAEGYFIAETSTIDLETGQGNPYWPYSFAAEKVVVEVDDETGKVDVIEIVACHDSGKIVNPMLAEGQVQGGAAMGIGFALMEEIEFDKGTIKNPNFSDYIIPTSMDMPKFTSMFVEEEEASGPFGAKGLGEPTLIPTAPAIINAIYDAVGIRINDLPATCEKVLKAIKEKVRIDE